MVRIKHRYFVLEMKKKGHKDKQISDVQLYHSIISNVRHLHGEYGEIAVKPAMNVKYINKDTGLFILRTRLGPHRIVASSLPLVRTIDEITVKVSTLYIGACIKQCLLFIKKYQIDEYQSEAVTLNQQSREKLKKNYKEIDIQDEQYYGGK